MTPKFPSSTTSHVLVLNCSRNHLRLRVMSSLTICLSSSVRYTDIEATDKHSERSRRMKERHCWSANWDLKTRD